MPLGRHYISINNVPIPNPVSNGISFENIETIKKSEDGHDVGEVTRLMKATFTFSFQCTSGGRDKIFQYCSMAEVTVTFDGVNYVGRLRCKSSNMVKDSEYNARTNGLWVLSVTFTEN